MDELPVLGMAVQIEDIRRYLPLIMENHRDLELQDFFMADVLGGNWKPLAAEIKTLLAGHRGRIGLHGPFWGLDISNPDPEMQRIVTRRMMQCLDVCAELGATQMVVHSPYTLWDYHNLDNFSGRSAYAWIVENCHQTLKPVITRAEALDVTIVIENVQDRDPDIRCALADSFESDHVAVSVDTGHAFYMQGTSGAPAVDYFIRRAGRRLQHVHLQDSDGYADRHWAIGDGGINWRAAFKALADCDSAPRLILELSDKSGLPRSLDYLQSLGLAR